MDAFALLRASGSKEPLGFTFYVHLDEKGNVAELRILNRQGEPKYEAAFELAFSKVPFRPVVCNGVAAEVEFVSCKNLL